MLSPRAFEAILGIPGDVPLSIPAMAGQLRVTYFPHTRMTPRLVAFTSRLRDVLVALGVRVLPFEETLARGGGRKVEEGVVILAAGEMETGSLPVDFVANLRRTTIVGILDAPCPADTPKEMQAKLDNIVQELSWNIVQVVLFVENDRWTICTMNGAIIPCRLNEGFGEDVERTFISKVAAPVVPPHAADFRFEEGALSMSAPGIVPHVRDFEESAPLWERTGVMLFHTSTDTLRFRSPFYRRIASAYLDRRSGMSYGFLSRQLPVPVAPARGREEARHFLGSSVWEQDGVAEHDGRLFVRVPYGDQPLLVEVPPVQVLATRSGCDKAHINGKRDLMLMELDRGTITFRTPVAEEGIDYRPSYDTLTILAHAVGNALIASVMRVVAPGAVFLRHCMETGVALAHWHGIFDSRLIAKGYHVYGEQNPPVSCSTHQAAFFALEGKLRVLMNAPGHLRDHAGDVHIEPHHGVNVTWPTLTGLARVILSGRE